MSRHRTSFSVVGRLSSLIPVESPVVASALLALFLASPASDYISGQVFTIDGGAMGRGPGI